MLISGCFRDGDCGPVGEKRLSNDDDKYYDDDYDFDVDEDDNDDDDFYYGDHIG